MSDCIIFVTGYTGYIGSNFVKHLKLTKDKYQIVTIGRNIESINNNEHLNSNSKMILFHLATHFSKENSESQLIEKCNIDFGKNILKFFENKNLTKIIYTNSMYSFYKDKRIRNLYYTQSKNIFSEHLNNFVEKNGIILDEIFLDNTFGNIDKRKKIVQTIVDSIKLEKSNPVQNKNLFVNLTYILDVIKRLESSISNNIFTKSSFISQENVNINSIYEFLNLYYKERIVDKSLISWKELDYISNFPKISTEGILMTGLYDGLINTFNINNSYGNF